MGAEDGILKRICSVERHSQRVIVFCRVEAKVRSWRARCQADMRMGEVLSDLDQTVRENVMLDFGLKQYRRAPRQRI